MRRTPMRFLIPALVLAAALPSPADDSLAAPGEHALALDVQESKRTSLVHVPKKFQKGKPVPLVVALHGAASNGRQTKFMTGFSELADEKTFAVAYPDGEHRVWRYVELGKKEDFEFMGALMDRLVADGIADPRRIYFTGISNGAYFSNALAISMGDRIAAIAPVAGTVLELGKEKLKPKRAVPVMYFHGTEDRLVGYNGKDFISKTESSMSAEELASWWAKTNGCKAEPKKEKVEDAKEDGTTVEKWTYEGGAPVIFYRIEGGGHTWPGMKPVAERLLGPVCEDIDASRLIWEFFEKQALPEEK
jgi:polyhydroxybutyrate depolymerase